MEEQQAEVKQIELVILRSPNGRTHWKPVRITEVPEWVKKPDNMARLVAGDACMKCDEGPWGSDWYVALKPEAVERFLRYQNEAIAKAQAKREMRARKRIAQAH